MNRSGLLLWGIVALAMGACQFKGAGSAAPDTARDYWQPRAVAMRIYPATRFIQEQGDTLLNAQVELRDEMGDSIKAAGRVRFDLFASDEAGQNLGRRLYHWEVALRTLEQQRTHFDAVTRTYQFRLSLDNHAATKRPTVLRAVFMRAGDGSRLETQAPMERE